MIFCDICMLFDFKVMLINNNDALIIIKLLLQKYLRTYLFCNKPNINKPTQTKSELFWWKTALRGHNGVTW